MIFTDLDNRINLRPLCKKIETKKYRRNIWPLKKRPQKNKKRLWHNEIK